eukprot:m.91760 g.91760  ORF g.91760 m.91760 type:complete len:158 (-) comp15050_c0_seq1:603-1076(-)
MARSGGRNGRTCCCWLVTEARTQQPSARLLVCSTVTLAALVNMLPREAATRENFPHIHAAAAAIVVSLSACWAGSVPEGRDDEKKKKSPQKKGENPVGISQRALDAIFRWTLLALLLHTENIAHAPHSRCFFCHPPVHRALSTVQPSLSFIFDLCAV